MMQKSNVSATAQKWRRDMYCCLSGSDTLTAHGTPSLQSNTNLTKETNIQVLYLQWA